MRIVVSGNSIPLQVYPRANDNRTFCQILGDEYEVIVTCDIKKTIRQAEAINDVICFYPDYTILCYGIVECYPLSFGKARMDKSKFRYYTEMLIKTIRVMCDSKIIILGILPVNSYWENKRSHLKNNVYSYNKILNEIAAEYACQFIDLSDFKEEVKPQGFHLNQEGHIKLAERIDFELQE